MKTVKELSVELSLDRSTLLKAVQCERIPGYQSGDIWLINEESPVFTRWLTRLKRKHGKYNAETHLPDNNMQPRSSDGLYVWLNDAVIQTYGYDLVLASQRQPQRYQWLLAQLKARTDDEQAQRIVQEYAHRHKAIEHARRQAHRRFDLAQLEARVQEDDVPNRDYLEKRIEKLKKSIKQADTRYQQQEN